MKYLFLFLLASIPFQNELLGKEPDDNPPRVLQKSNLIQRGYIEDHWFYGIHVGPVIYFGDHDRQLSLGKRFTPKFEVFGGKWFNNSFGGRLSVGGVEFKGVTQDSKLSNGLVYDPSQSLKHQTFNYLNINVDFLVNWSNDLVGDNPNRVYSLVPYASVGLIMGLNHQKAVRITPGLGFLHVFRVNNTVDLQFDIRGTLHGDGFDGEDGGRNLDGTLSTLVGISFRIK